MITHSDEYYLKKMSVDARKAVLSILSKKPNHIQLKKDVAAYYRLRKLSNKSLSK